MLPFRGASNWLECLRTEAALLFFMHTSLYMSLMCLFGFLLLCSVASIVAVTSLFTSRIASGDTVAEGSPLASESFQLARK